MISKQCTETHIQPDLIDLITAEILFNKLTYWASVAYTVFLRIGVCDNLDVLIYKQLIM